MLNGSRLNSVVLTACFGPNKYDAGVQLRPQQYRLLYEDEHHACVLDATYPQIGNDSTLQISCLSGISTLFLLTSPTLLSLAL